MKGLRRNGFTLIELLVTMAIAGVLLTILASMMFQSSNGYVISQRAVDQISQARALIQLMDHELSTRLPETPLIHQTQKPAQIAWFRTISTNEESTNSPGDLTMVCYELQYIEDPHGDFRPSLLRKCILPAETRQILENQSSLTFPETDPETDEIVLDDVLVFSIVLQGFNSATQQMEPSDPDLGIPMENLILTLSLVDQSITRNYSDVSEWQRLATSPKPEELPYIRTFKYTFDLTR